MADKITSFTFKKGKVIYTSEDIPNLEEPLKSILQERHNNRMLNQMSVEREWRNERLTNSDKMLVADATYNGQPLFGSTELDEILAYRQQLRDYNLTTDDRPVPPTWYNE